MLKLGKTRAESANDRGTAEELSSHTSEYSRSEKFTSAFGSKFKSFCASHAGNLAIVWAVGLSAVSLGVGTAADVTRIYSLKTKSQNVVDAAGLSAAAFVRTHQRKPENASEGLYEDQTYSASEMSISTEGSENITFTVKYDDVKREVSVVGIGTAKPLIMNAFGVENLRVKTTTTIKYQDVDFKNPASITLVLDNSGSMWFDDKPSTADTCHHWYYGEYTCYIRPEFAAKRIDSLKSSVKSFMGQLDEVNTYHENVYGTDEKILRTSMMAYNSDNIFNHQVDPFWGILSDSQVNQMSPEGATNSAPSMDKALNWMKAEPAIHDAENGEDKPLRYVIFMTDGMNTIGDQIWIEGGDTNFWRREVRERRCNYYGCWYVDSYDYDDGRIGPNGEHLPPNYGQDWEEGRLTVTADADTLQDCAQMKAEGIEVFTVGFALNAGTYYTNDWASLPTGGGEFYNVDERVKATAAALLRECASSPDNFMLANSTKELDEAFKIIGKDIVTEVIRIAN